MPYFIRLIVYNVHSILIVMFSKVCTTYSNTVCTIYVFCIKYWKDVHTILYALSSKLCICPLHSMIYMTHYVCYLIYFIIYTLRSILCTQLMYSLSCIVKYTFNSLHYIPCFLHFVLYPLSSTRYAPYSMPCTSMSMLYALHYILYN